MAAAARCLGDGGVVVYPTDTFYGLAVDPRDPAAVERLFHVKRRPAGVAVPLIGADAHQVDAWAGPLGPASRRLAARFWPGPLTLIVDAAATLDRRVLGTGATVAVRVPAHPVARALADALDHPITATSANRSGSPAATTAREAVDALGDELALALDAGPTAGGEPSTIIDARGEVPVLIRTGVVPWDRVLQSLA